MVFGRIRYAKRSFSRMRRSKTLSSYRIATRTGAKAQSRQIYALNRKIRRIERRTRPEIKILEYDGSSITPGSVQTAGSGSYAGGYSVFGSNLANTIDGNFARLLDATFYFTASYNSGTTNITPYYIRVVGVQLKATRSDDLNFLDVWSYNAGGLPSTGNGFIISTTDDNTKSAKDAFFGPLSTGLARTAKVLFERKLYLTDQRPTVSFKAKVRRLLNFYKNPSENIAKGAIRVFVLIYNSSVNGAGSVVSMNFELNAKLAYTDA